MNLVTDWNDLIAEINAKIKVLPAYLHAEIVKEETWAATHPFWNVAVWFSVGALFVASIWAL